MRKKIWGNWFAFSLRKRMRKQIPRFSFVIIFVRRVPPCAVKTCAVRPVFARVVGELRAADPSNVQGPIQRNASPGEQSEAPRPRWKQGQEQNPGSENQDSQHMLEQPRRYFLDLCGFLICSLAWKLHSLSLHGIELTYQLSRHSYHPNRKRYMRTLLFNSVHTRCIVKTSGFTRVFVKIGNFIKFKGFPVEILENRRSWENKKPQKIARKVDFSEPRLLQCT